MHLIVDELLLRERRVWTAWFDELVDLEGDGTWAARVQGDLDLVVDANRVQICGTLSGLVPRECDRCLAWLSQEGEAPLYELCLVGAGPEGDGAWDEETELWRVGVGGRLDLTEMVRQALILALPTRARCVVHEANNEPATPPREARADPRWAALGRLKVTGEDDGGPQA